jgi:hypothetical protein
MSRWWCEAQPPRDLQRIDKPACARIMTGRVPTKDSELVYQNSGINVAFLAVLELEKSLCQPAKAVPSQNAAIRTISSLGPE